MTEHAYPHVYFRGRWTTRDEAVVPVGSLAMRYGISVFEGLRLYEPQGGGLARPFLLDEHLERMRRSLRTMRLPDPGIDSLPEVIGELAERNDIRADAYVRIAATPFHPGDLGDPGIAELSATAAPMGRKPWLAGNRAMRLRITDWQRAAPQAHPPAAKNIANYAGPRLAWLEAKEAGYDGCVLTNRFGRLSEAPTAALFLVHGGVLSTPALSEDVLPSITRAWVLRRADQLGVQAREGELTTQDAYLADEAFLCGTGIEFAPVLSFDRREPLPHGVPLGPVTAALVGRFFTEVRSQPAGTAAQRGGAAADHR